MSESFVQTVNLCQGANYALSFQYNNIYNKSGTLSVLLANNVPGNCANLTGSPNLITQISLSAIATQPPKTLSPWVSVINIPIPANLTANTQLIFATTPLGNNAQFDVGIDNISVTCQQSGLTPQINVSNSNNNFTFSGSTNTIPGNGVTNWCWTFGDGSTSVGPNVMHTYQQPGTYAVCLTIIDACGGCTSKVCQNVEVGDCGCNNSSLIVYPNDPPPTFPGDLIDRDIILAPGTHLTISNRVLDVKSTCKIVVLRGASLVVDNSTLKNYCNAQKWQGIVVWGNSTVQHAGHTTIPQASMSDPGIAIIQNKSHINNAQTALQAQRWWSDSRNDAFFTTNYPGLIQGYRGGIVQGNGSEFSNNRKSADIGSYGFNNLSSFTDCSFNSSTPDPGNGSGNEGVNIWNTNGVTFTNCVFNSVPARGITAIDAAINVTKSTFTNNYQGIAAGSAAFNTGTTLIGTGLSTGKNTFASNKFGVWADGINQLHIEFNDFTSNVYSGIRASSYANFFVSYNNFSGNDQGLTIMNTGSNLQRIFCNTHVNDRWAIFASANCLGALFTKNDYNNINADVLLQGLNGTPGILPNQVMVGSDPSTFNYFSLNRPNIVTEAPTNTFLYAPPLASLVPPAFASRELPICDDDDAGCTMNNNYHNTARVNGTPGCVLTASDQPPCTDRKCLDSLDQRLKSLQLQTANDAQKQYKTEMQGTERRFLSDKRALVEKWYSEGNIALIEQTLGAYGQMDDKQLLYGIYVRQGNLTQAANVLSSFPASTTEDVWFKNIQTIYLNYLAANTVPYIATHTQDSLLETVATSIQSVGANARAIYYLLHGIWLKPIEIVGDRQPIINTLPKSDVVDMLLIPNPANDVVTVRLPSASGSLQIFDMFGKLQQSISISNTDTELNASTLTNGIYLLHYYSPAGIHAQAKLVIQH